MTRRMLAVMLMLLAPAGAAAAQTHMVKEGDTLWALAGKYCGQPFDWEKLYEANKTLIKDPHWIYPDMQLSLPLCGVSPAKPVAAEPAPKAEPEMKAAAPAESAVAAESAPRDEEAAPAAETELSAEEIAAAETLPPVSPDGMPAVKGKYVVMPKECLEVSEHMPKDMTWGMPSSSAERLSPDWKQDGKVRLASLEDEEDDLAGMGDVIEIKITSGVKLKYGDYLKIYRIGLPEKDADGKITALLAQQSALVKIVGVNGSVIKAEIVRISNPVEKGDAVKKL